MPRLTSNLQWKRGFILELWSSAADLYTVGFVSPGGERISRIPILSNNETRIPFLLESTVITVSYQLIEAGSGSKLVSMRFERPSPGIWTIRVYNTQFLTGEYHMWLPVQGFISDETVFLKPDPSNTITVPGNSRLPITTGAYNHRNNSIYIHSSRGYTSRDYVKPDLAAPGVEILGPSVRISAAFRPDEGYRRYQELEKELQTIPIWDDRFELVLDEMEALQEQLPIF